MITNEEAYDQLKEYIDVWAHKYARKFHTEDYHTTKELFLVEAKIGFQQAYNKYAQIAQKGEAYDDELFLKKLASVYVKRCIQREASKLVRRLINQKEVSIHDYIDENDYETGDPITHNEKSLQLETVSTEDQILKKEQHQELYKSINQLKPKYKQVIIDKYFNQLTNEEIAQAEGISRQAIEQRLTKATKKLKEIMQA